LESFQLLQLGGFECRGIAGISRLANHRENKKDEGAKGGQVHGFGEIFMDQY
jgi:hypothetical protein